MPYTYTFDRSNKLQEAEKYYQNSLDIKKAIYGESHWQIARTLNGKAQLLFLNNKFEEALPVCESVKEMLKVKPSYSKQS